MFKYYKNSKKAFGTVEIVLITAVLIALAMMFRSTIIKYAKNLFGSAFDENPLQVSREYEDE